MTPYEATNDRLWLFSELLSVIHASALPLQVSDQVIEGIEALFQATVAIEQADSGWKGHSQCGTRRDSIMTGLLGEDGAFVRLSVERKSAFTEDDHIIFDCLISHLCSVWERREEPGESSPAPDTHQDFGRLSGVGLTKRECEIIRCLSAGMDNGTIAEILQCARRTVEKHLEHILPKLGAENRFGAVRGARRWLIQDNLNRHNSLEG